LPLRTTSICYLQGGENVLQPMSGVNRYFGLDILD
jgi:hypothetical protein